jgi:hypothetical protein
VECRDAVPEQRDAHGAIPAKIAEAARNATEGARATAEAQAKAAQAKVEHAATKAIERVAIDSAKKVAATQLLKWICGAIVLICAGLVVMFVCGARSGRAEGADAARARCEQDTAAAAWMRSPEGQVAYELAKAGNLRNLANCDLSGWEATRDGTCVVRPHKGKTFGWRIPQPIAAEQ